MMLTKINPNTAWPFIKLIVTRIYFFINFTFLSPAILFQINVIGELSRFRQTYDAFVALWRVISITLLHNFDIIDIMNKSRMYWCKEFSKNVKSHAIC